MGTSQRFVQRGGEIDTMTAAHHGRDRERRNDGAAAALVAASRAALPGDAILLLTSP